MQGRGEKFKSWWFLVDDALEKFRYELNEVKRDELIKKCMNFKHSMRRRPERGLRPNMVRLEVGENWLS